MSFESDGLGSQLNISSLVGLAGAASADGLQVTNGGTVNDAKLTSLGDTTLTLDGSGTLGISQFTAIYNGTINNRGGTPIFSSLSNIEWLENCRRQRRHAELAAGDLVQ